MGKKAKVGKARKDKFYRLAKESGYRSRAAFKLTQLNRKFEFFDKARVVVDLCAAPGGWLQVAAENTPVSALIVGVDLVSIRPIHKCSTFQADITTEKCRQRIRQELKTWKADIFLNDGAPNVGKNWVHDAFQQAELTLHAARLATDFLKKGGWFITKVFRSKDYFSLLWVLQQLFEHVHATKPQASRSESAEIFVVCQGFLAPDKIDPKFLNPKHVFKDVEPESRQLLDLLHPEKKKRHRDGYAEGDYTLFHTLPASEFFSSENYLELLAGANEVTLDDKRIADHKRTTPELMECLKDIKVLGKKDIKSLITWRKKLNEELDTGPKAADTKETDKSSGETEPVEKTADDEEKDEEEEVEKQLQTMEDTERKALKRKLKKTRREKTKLRHRMDMKMDLPGDMPDIADDVDIFNLKKIKNKKHLEAIDLGDQSFHDSQPMLEDDPLPQPSRRAMASYDRDQPDYMDKEELSDIEMESDPELSGDDDREADLELHEEHNPLMVDLQKSETKTSTRINSWFSKGSFADLEDDDDEDLEIEQIASRYRSQGGKISEKPTSIKDKSTSKSAKQKSAENEETSDEDDDESDSDDDSTDSDSDYDVAKMKANAGRNAPKDGKKGSGSENKDGFDIVPTDNAEYKRLDAVGMAIGAALINSRKRKRDMIDGGYHRYMFNDDGLPDWFTQDETKHHRIQLPVTKGDIQEYRDKMKVIDAQPIKKIAQAKARKKRKEMRRVDRARKRSEVVTDNTEASEKEKWQQIKQIYKKAGLINKKKKDVAYVVAKKGMGKRVRRPAGVSGNYKVVDPRMKKDKMAEKKNMKNMKKKGGKKQQTSKKGKR